MIKKIVTICLLSTFVFSSGVNAQSPLSNKNLQVVNRYKEVKSNYLKQVDFYKNARADFITSKNKYRQVKNKVGTQELLERTKKFLTNMIQAMINYLQAVKTKAENYPHLSPADRNSIIAELDSDIAWLAQQQSEIQNASTQQQIVDHAKVVRNHWLKIRGDAKRITGHILASHINRIIAKSKDYSQRIEDKIAELQSQGYDTTDLENWLEDYNEKIELAETRYESAKEKFNDISSSTGADSLFRKGHTFLREANRYLKDAHVILRQIVTALKQITTNQDSTSTNN